MRVASVRAWRVASLLGALACGPTAASNNGTQKAGGDSSGTSATLLFGDEFSGPAVDRTKWTVYTGEVYNSELQEYVDDSANVYVARGAEAAGASDGALVITARRRAGTTGRPGRAEFTSARLHGRALYQFGTIAARIKLPAGTGLWPAFWLLGGGAWPKHGEIDVMENVGDPRWVSAALHGPGYSGNTPLTHRWTLPGSDVTAWHEYAVTWTVDGVVFRVDDAAIYRVTRAQVAAYGAPTALDSAKYVVLNLALGGEYPAAVNGIRSPRLGLPASTLPLIDRGEAKMLVDWVRWTR